MADKQSKMTISEHLEELRTRLLRSFLATLVGFALAFVFIDEVFMFMKQPLYQAAENRPELRTELNQFTPFGAFFMSMKLAFIVGMVGAAPVIIGNVWGFVAAGLYRHERSTVKFYAIPGLLLFFAGVFLAYRFVMPYALEFLLGWSAKLEIGSVITAQSYISLVAWAMFVFGLMFQLPLIMVFLMRLGVVEPDTFRKYRRHSIVVVFAVAMMLTPPDVISQIALAGCMLVLYESAILIGTRVAKKREAPVANEGEES